MEAGEGDSPRRDAARGRSVRNRVGRFRIPLHQRADVLLVLATEVVELPSEAGALKCDPFIHDVSGEGIKFKVELVALQDEIHCGNRERCIQ